VAKTQSEDQIELLRVLRSQEYPTVKVTISYGKVKKEPLEKAIRLVKAGKYRWSGSKFRVKHMEPIGPMQPDRPWSSCYRTMRAPALPPSAEWVRRVALGQ
jgi:hypothetical protein